MKPIINVFMWTSLSFAQDNFGLQLLIYVKTPVFSLMNFTLELIEMFLNGTKKRRRIRISKPKKRRLFILVVTHCGPAFRISSILPIHAVSSNDILEPLMIQMTPWPPCGKPTEQFEVNGPLNCTVGIDNYVLRCDNLVNNR